MSSALPSARRSLASFALATVALVACHSSPNEPPLITGFLAGTSTNPEIGFVVNSTGRALTLFQLGSPTTKEVVGFGTSTTITPVGLSQRGNRAAVPLGDAASVALVDLQTANVIRYFTFPSGNTTGSVLPDDTTLVMANYLTGVVGRAVLTQASDAITTTVAVAPKPTAMVMAGARLIVVSSNLDSNYAPLGNGVVTAIDPVTMKVLGTVSSGGTNSSDIAVGPDGFVYVVNTGDYFTDGSVTIIDPATLTVKSTVGAMGVGPGAISIDAGGIAYVSSFGGGTLAWNTKTKTFVRDETHPICAPLKGGGCRGAAAASTDAEGDLYQAFFGDGTNPPYLFVYKGASYALTDSVSVGVGPSSILVRNFH